MKKEFAAVLGATASGKSALAMYLAERHGGEIVSCDSMQIYRGMDIGTAKPTAEETSRVPHHLIDILSPDEDFSAGDFAVLAGEAIDGILSRGRLPIVCGGTFLYLDSLTEVSSLSDSSKDEKLRAELERFAAENGAAALHGRLEKIDPESAAAIHENNVKRVVRAIEIYETTGKPKSEWDRLSKESEPPYKAHRVAILYHDRELLYRRIDERVDRMMEEGLLEEVRGLLPYRDLPALNTVGYRELFGFMDKMYDLQEAVRLIKRNTRHYAKKQLTWWARDPSIRWIGLHADAGS